MLADFKMPVAEDDNDRKLLSDVSEYGWHILNILADKDGPAFSFSVGFYYRFGHPEILVMGLPQQTSDKLLNHIGAQIAKGTVFRPQERSDDLLEGFQCCFVPILSQHYREYLGYAGWFYRSLKQPFPALQLVWPDKQGRFPWEPGYDQRFFELQKLLNTD